MTTVDPAPPLRVELPARELTLDDVAALAAADRAHRYELVDGNLLVMPPADVDHQRIIMRMGAWFLAHGYTDEVVLPTPGLQIKERSGGRNPDLLILRGPVAGETIWVDAADTLLAIDVVSPGSQSEDRVRKPVEYASAGVPRYWRVERTGGAATVHMYTLGVGEHGERVYIGHRAVLLADLLASPPQLLSE